MNDYINKIYDLLYSPMVTPYNLLDNAKLPNYEYVNYYKKNDGLITEMKCTLDDGENAVFYYHFDKSDNLQRVYMNKNDQQVLVFDRQTETQKLLSEYLKDKDSVASAAI